MYPLAICTLNDSLCAKHHTERIILVKALENSRDLVFGIFSCGFYANAGKYLVGMMVVMVMASAGAMLVVVVMMVLVAFAMLVMVVMMVLVAFAMLIVVVMMVLVAFAMLIVVMMMVLVAFAMLIVVVMMVVVMLLKLCLKLLEGGIESISVFHCLKDLFTRKLVHRSGYNNGILIMLAKERNGLGNLLLARLIGMRKNYGGSVGYLIVIEFTEITDIHLALARIGNGGEAIKYRIGALKLLNRLDYIGKLAYA